MPPELLGPAGLLVAALLTVGVLWRDHQRRDVRIEAQNDALTASIADIAETTRAQNEVIKDALRGRAPRSRPTRE